MAKNFQEYPNLVTLAERDAKGFLNHNNGIASDQLQSQSTLIKWFRLTEREREREKERWTRKDKSQFLQKRKMWLEIKDN